MAIDGDSIRKIHKKLYDMTINNKKIFIYMSKVASKTVKVVDKKKDNDYNSGLILALFASMSYNKGIKKLINHELMEEAEDKKDKEIKNFIKESRSQDKWFYLASSHADSAKDHAPYQGKLYYDDKAPQEIVNYAKSKGLRSLQWVMDGPVWFITRPNCRHFFKSLPLEAIKNKNNKELIRKYKMHRMTGDTSLKTPRKIVIEEYEDRLRMLKSMYNEHKTEHLRREIQKIELLIRKHKNLL